MIAEQRIAVLGAGSWGTALALHLARNGADVVLWGHRPESMAVLAADRCNQRYLPDIRFPPKLAVAAQLNAALDGADAVLLVVPSGGFAQTLQAVAGQLPNAADFAWATKGLQKGTGQFLHTVVADWLGADRPVAMISGPSFAAEVATGLPTALTVAAVNDNVAQRWATRLHGSGMLAYTSNDIVGVELGGAVKNVLAIAAGIADGLGFGANARAAVITRGLAELRRLGDVLGGERDTFAGLTGVGDVVLTCTDNLSRNRRFGLAIGQGHDLVGAQKAIGQVVEGIDAAKEIAGLASHHDVDMPICIHVAKVLFESLSPRQAVQALLARPPRPENI